MQQPEITSPLNQYLNLLIICDRDAHVKNIISTMTGANLLYNYDVISAQEINLLPIINKYDAIIFDYNLSGTVKQSPLIEFSWLFNLNKKIPIILLTDPLGDEIAIECIKAGVNGYLLRHKLRDLPKTITQSIFELNQQEKLQQQVIINDLIQKTKNHSSLSHNLQLCINIIEENLTDTKCLIAINQKDNNTVNHNLYYTANQQKEFDLNHWQFIVNHYHELLLKGQPVLLNKFDNIVPKIVTNIVNKYFIKNILLLPLIFENIYLGVICFYNYCDGWSNNDLNLIEIIAEQCSFIIHEYYVEKEIKQCIKIKENEQKNFKIKDNNRLELFSQLTHELRTPLTGILGFAKMLDEQIYGELNHKQIQYVQAIRQSGAHLLELINDILDLSKIDAAKEELFFEKIAVEDICLASMSIVENMANQKKLELKLDINPQIDFCKCDRRRLKQILINLLSNAIKFTETGSITLRVNIEKKQIAFSVIDTGIGIKKEDQAKLFQPFVQLKTPMHKNNKGTGLGLALSRKLAQLHGGDIIVTSELDKGSCFTVYLPL